MFRRPDTLLPLMYATVPPAFDPASSLLGRLVRRWAHDERQAASLYVVAAALMLVVATLAGQWGWVLWGQDADGASNLVLFAVQIGGGLLVGCAALVGWRRPIHVHADSDALTVQCGAESFVLSLDALSSAERITPSAYHRHWRRYAATRSFVNRLPDVLLLLRTDHGPIVLGLSASDLERLETYLSERLAARRARAMIRAAYPSS